MLEETEEIVRERLGRAVFGRDGGTLASAVGDRLISRGETLSTAESCTGGLIGTMLTDVPGSSRYYLGSIIAYANSAKASLLGVAEPLLAAHGAVSQPVAEAMARSVRERLNSTWALSVTGIAGPDGGSPKKPVGLVYVGLAGPGGLSSREFRFGDDSPRDVIRSRAALTALNLLRLAL
jgi:nicotinamide-nucleotide amidase